MKRVRGLELPSQACLGIKGYQKRPDHVVELCLDFLNNDGIKDVILATDKLRALGLVKEDGTTDYSLAL